MGNKPRLTSFQEICVIVNSGIASKILQRSKKMGIPGGTVILGKGTVNHKVANFLGITDSRKEIIKMVSDTKNAYEVLDRLNVEFQFEKANHGIAFTSSVKEVYGSRNIKNKEDYANDIEERCVGSMYQAINVIVDRGNAEFVIDAASKAGSKGGTIIHGRGSGTHEVSKVFAIDIEPEKEIVLILSKVDETETIIKSISEELKIDEPGKGVIFVQDVNKTYGLYE